MVGTPVLVWVMCLGCGLALERLLRVRLSNGLVLALGLCVSYVLIMPGYTAGAGDALAIALLAVVALAGMVFARDGLRARVNPGWAGVAGLGTYVIFMLPVIVYGHWTWSGYDFVNDSSFEMLLANHVKGFGTTLGHISESSERQFLVQYLNNGYPLGTQALLGTLSGVLAAPVAVLYQGYISSLAALGAVALCSVAERRVVGWRAAAVALAAICANLTYQYALQGAIKEIGLLAVLCCCGGARVRGGRRSSARMWGPRWWPSRRRRRSRPTTSWRCRISARSCCSSASAWCSCDAAGRVLAGSCRWRPGACLTLVLSIPSLTSLGAFLSVAQSGQGATGLGATQFGQLLRKLPLSQLSGVWLAGEYRLPVAGGIDAKLTALASAAILVLLVVSARVGAASRGTWACC